MEEYLAKSSPKETIQEHTDKLLYNYELIKKIYPSIKVDWELLHIACLYHDIGKINSKFQDKIKNGIRHEDEVPHGFLSLTFLNTRELKKKYTKPEIRILANAIAFHHERPKPDDDTYDAEIENLKSQVDDFEYEKIPELRQPKKLSEKYFNWRKTYEEDGEDIFHRYIMLKGLLNRIDYAASAHEDAEIENSFLEPLLEDIKNSWKKKDKPLPKWNCLQRYMMENRDNNIVAVAQTGMGKTEAGLLWIGNSKGFFTLPLKTAINSIYERIKKEIPASEVDKKVGLLHSETYKQYLDMEGKRDFESEEEMDIESYYTKTRQLSMPLTVCTLDQIFDFVYKYGGFELKPATLSYSKVVIDEIQMYSPNLLAYIVFGLSYITKLGGKFAILTATLAPFVIDLLESEGIKFEMPEKPFINDKIRHSVKVVNSLMDSDFIAEKYNENKVLVICNTVKEAQRVHKELIEKIKTECKDESRVKLFHSSFTKMDRKSKEAEILEIGDKDNKDYGIWVCTQVVEASLDIDFDLLFTELSDLNGLFQRMGRCYRSREFEKEGHNCYVFDGGSKECSGVGKFIDEKIFKLSKNAISDIDSELSEQKKIDLIEDVYTTEKLEKTGYKEQLTDALNYLKALTEFEKTKKEAKDMFRDIDSFTVMPKCVYEENKEIIDSLI